MRRSFHHAAAKATIFLSTLSESSESTKSSRVVLLQTKDTGRSTASANSLTHRLAFQVAMTAHHRPEDRVAAILIQCAYELESRAKKSGRGGGGKTSGGGRNPDDGSSGLEAFRGYLTNRGPVPVPMALLWLRYCVGVRHDHASVRPLLTDLLGHLDDEVRALERTTIATAATTPESMEAAAAGGLVLGDTAVCLSSDHHHPPPSSTPPPPASSASSPQAPSPEVTWAKASRRECSALLKQAHRTAKKELQQQQWQRHRATTTGGKPSAPQTPPPAMAHQDQQGLAAARERNHCRGQPAGFKAASSCQEGVRGGSRGGGVAGGLDRLGVKGAVTTTAAGRVAQAMSRTMSSIAEGLSPSHSTSSESEAVLNHSNGQAEEEGEEETSSSGSLLAAALAPSSSFAASPSSSSASSFSLLSRLLTGSSSSLAGDGHMRRLLWSRWWRWWALVLTALVAAASLRGRSSRKPLLGDLALPGIGALHLLVQRRTATSKSTILSALGVLFALIYGWKKKHRNSSLPSKPTAPVGRDSNTELSSTRDAKVL